LLNKNHSERKETSDKGEGTKRAEIPGIIQAKKKHCHGSDDRSTKRLLGGAQRRKAWLQRGSAKTVNRLEWGGEMDHSLVSRRTP